MRGHFINIIEYLPLRGNSYIKLPEELQNSKKGLINIQNVDDKCFMWCYIRQLYPRKIHPERITKEDMEIAKNNKYFGLTFPVTRDKIPRFEKQNEINVFVYGYNTENKSPYPIYPTHYPEEPYDDNLDLLYIEEKDEYGEDNTHYVLITDLGKLVANHTKHKGKRYICRSMSGN